MAHSAASAAHSAVDHSIGSAGSETGACLAAVGTLAGLASSVAAGGEGDEKCVLCELKRPLPETTL